MTEKARTRILKEMRERVPSEGCVWNVDPLLQQYKLNQKKDHC